MQQNICIFLERVAGSRNKGHLKYYEGQARQDIPKGRKLCQSIFVSTEYIELNPTRKTHIKKKFLQEPFS